MNQDVKLLIIGEYCKMFRTHTLGMTLQQFERETGINLKTISSFENGKSTNILHILKYLDLCETNEERVKYLQGLNNVLEVL